MVNGGKIQIKASAENSFNTPKNDTINVGLTHNLSNAHLNSNILKAGNQKISNVSLHKPPLQQNSLQRTKKSSVSNDQSLVKNPSYRKIQVNINPYNYSKEQTPNNHSNIHKREDTNTVGSTSRSPINFEHSKYNNEIRNSRVNLTNSEHSLTNLNVKYKDTSVEYPQTDNNAKNSTRRHINFENQQSNTTLIIADGNKLNTNTTIKKTKESHKNEETSINNRLTGSNRNLSSTTPERMYYKNGQQYTFNDNNSSSHANSRVYSIQQNGSQPKYIRKSVVNKDQPIVNHDQTPGNGSTTNITLSIGGPKGDCVTINSNQIQAQEQKRYSYKKEPQTNTSFYGQNSSQEPSKPTVIRRSLNNSNDCSPRVFDHLNVLDMNSNRNSANNSFMNHNQFPLQYQAERKDNLNKKRVTVETAPGTNKVAHRNKSQPTVGYINSEINPA